MSRVFAMMSDSMGRQRTDRGISATAASSGPGGNAPVAILADSVWLANPSDSLCGVTRHAGPRSWRQYDAGTTLALPTGFDRSGSNSAASVLANGWEVARS